MIGKLFRKAVQVVNTPARIVEAGVDVLLDEPGATRRTVGLSKPLERVGDVLEESLEESSDDG